MKQADLYEFLAACPIAPFIREGDMAVRKPWRYPERRLLDYLLVYIKEGQCRFIVDGEAYELSPGEYALIQPGSLVDLEGLTNTVTPYLHFDMFYRPNRRDSFPTRPGQYDLTAYAHLLQPRLNDLDGVEVPVRLRPGEPAKFRDTFLRLVRDWPRRDPISMLETHRLATELILSLLLDYGQFRHAASPAAQTLDWIPSYVSNHIREPLAVSDLAQRAGLSPSRFNVLFKQQYGVAPHQYVLELRIRHAEELLTTSKLSHEAIADYCGFANLHHFSKAFKKRRGLPPGQWRLEKSGH